jgi:hypothetical protein
MAARPGRSAASPRAGRVLKAVLAILMTAMLAGSVVGFGGPLIDTGQDIRYGLASRGWPGTVGIVEHAYVETRGERRPTRFLRIRYRYEADGRTLHSERVGTTSAYPGMSDVVAAYPAGAEVLVYHAPGGSVAVLERGVGVFDVFKFVLMLLCLLVTVVFFGALLHLLVTTPAQEFLAQLGAPAPHHPQDPGRQRRADRAMEAEIAERLRERGRDPDPDPDPDQS